MSNDFAPGVTGDSEPTIAEIVAGVQPMGDLGRFVIDDMSADQEAEFFAILDEA